MKIKDGLANLQSQSRGETVIDLRENKKNLISFTSTFKYLKKTLTAEELASKCEDLKVNFV